MTKNENIIDEILKEDITLPESYLGLDHHNNSHYFLCPLFDAKAVLSFPRNYLNSYIGDGGRRNEINHPLYCLFKYDDVNSVVAGRINEYFHTHPNFAFSYYAGNSEGKSLIMYTLRAKEEQKQDYEYIVSGNYSKTSDVYKQLYKSFGFIKPTVKFLDEVVFKTPRFKKTMEDFLGVDIKDTAELWNPFESRREIFRYVETKS